MSAANQQMCAAHLELVRPIPIQGMLYVAIHELIEAAMFVFKIAFQGRHARKRRIHLGHAVKFHHDVPLGYVQATEAHFTARDPVADHASFSDQMIQKASHVVDPLYVREVR